MRKIIFDRVFEWDDEKNKANIKKHGISFESAIWVFFDPHYVEFPDDIHSDNELRYKAIGIVNDLLVVICTDRGDTTRIIFARSANAKEKRFYNDNRA